MCSSGLLCLKWNNHTSAFDKLLNNLHLRDMYSDGTIVCHGKFYPVHRFVLSTCSEYFEEIFHQSINLNSKHPFIIVKDIQPPQMEALLNYMYKGEVNVPQEMLPDLIKAAEAFKIKGLAVPDDEPPPCKSSSSRDRKRSSANLSSPSSQLKRSKRVDNISKSDKINSKRENDTIHSEELQTEPSNSSSMSKNYSSNAQKDMEDLFVPEILPNDIKSEQTDQPEYNDTEILDVTEEIYNKNAPSEEHYLSPKMLDIKDEKSIDSYPILEPFLPYEGDGNQPSNDQYDLAQSSSWDNSDGFKGDSNLEEGDSAEGNYQDSPDKVVDCPQDYFLNAGNSASALHINQKTPTTTDRLLKCSLCPYQSVWKHNLVSHYRKHTGEKPYKCSLCSYKASQRNNLQSHMKQHTGEKPYLCQYCDYKSAFKHALQRHLKHHHSNTNLK